MDSYYNLDNPAWYALTEAHACFALGDEAVKRYQSNIVAFAAYQQSKEISAQLNQLISINESFFIIGDAPLLNADYIIESILPCEQMVCTSEIKMEGTAAIEKLTEGDDDEITTLINLVQPGYYKPGTRLMGDYFGIRENNQLVSITGERMRMNGLTEISAVVTHPDFTGRKYAQQLLAHVANKNLAAGIIPFLHVAATNERAIKIYALLGFAKRRIINFTKIKREA
ncbi:GNAT family N-acetyltransferase [soil metagenome]